MVLPEDSLTAQTARTKRATPSTTLRSALLHATKSCNAHMFKRLTSKLRQEDPTTESTETSRCSFQLVFEKCNANSNSVNAAVPVAHRAGREGLQNGVRQVQKERRSHDAAEQGERRRSRSLTSLSWGCVRLGRRDKRRRVCSSSVRCAPSAQASKWPLDGQRRSEPPGAP